MSRFYHGWYIVAVSAAVYALITGATYNAFGLLVLPVSAEFKLSRADTNTALILFNLGNAVLAPIMGRLLDRISARRVMLAGSLLFGGSLATLGLSTSLWLSAAVLLIPLAIAYQSAGALTMSVFLARWFIARRGRAMALALMGLSLSSILVAPAMGYLIQNEGWRMALVIAGALIGVLLAALSFTVRDRPTAEEFACEAPTSAAAAARSAAPPSKVGTLLRSPLFWLYAVAITLGLGVVQAVAVSLIPLARGEGLTLMQATGLLSASGMAAITSKLLLAVVADRIDRTLLLSGLLAIGVLMCAALYYSGGHGALLASSVLMGVATGAVTPVYYALLADRFGTASFGTVRGLLAPFSAVGGMACVRAAGEVFDRTGNYDLLLLASMVGMAIAAALMFASRFARAPAVAVAAQPAPA
jgi:sugar phosphate permease